MKKNMDIVCMACGFLRESKELRPKIRDVSSRMLIIAAPTNYGNRQDLFYPAQYHDLVLSMFATNGNVKKSVNLNPSHGFGDSLAILGEDIRKINGEIDSGTSYATAITAGFAARLLDFSRHGDNKSALGDMAEKLKDKAKMTTFLLSLTTLDPPYHCIRPWDLLPANLQLPFSLANPPSDTEIENARRDVCKWMNWAIEGRLKKH